MVPVDQVCDYDPACYPTIQAAIDEGQHAVIEVLGGLHPGELRVTRDVTIRGVGGPVLYADPSLSSSVVTVTPGVSAAFEDLLVEAFGLARGIVADGAASVSLEGVTLSGGLGVGGSCLAAKDAGEVRLVSSLVTGCAGIDGAVHVEAGDLFVDLAVLVGNDTPALVASGSAVVEISDTIVDTNGWNLGGANGPAVHLVGVEQITVLRAWLCLNLDDGRAALEVEGGCTGSCPVEHAVLQLNGGRGLGWSGLQGLVRHTTFAANEGEGDGAQLLVSGGSLRLENAVVVDTGPIGGRTAMARTAEGAVTVADVAISANEPGIPLGVDGVAPFDPNFVVGYVPPACGLPVVFDPRFDDGSGVLVWPADEGKGALTTLACGPWCADADADGSPAMWDCAEDDPVLRHDAVEIAEDGIDQDCDGFDGCWLDADADGYGGSVVPLVPAIGCPPPYFAGVGGDCDDSDWTVSPDADESPADGTDSDCDGAELCWLDADGDGYSGPGLGPSPDVACGPPHAPADEGDCDDADPTIHPGADDLPFDRVDQDCRDGDADGWVAGGGCGCATGGADASLAATIAWVVARRRRRKH